MKDKYLPIKALNESAYSFLHELEGKPFEVGRYELDGGATQCDLTALFPGMPNIRAVRY